MKKRWILLPAAILLMLSACGPKDPAADWEKSRYSGDLATSSEMKLTPVQEEYDLPEISEGEDLKVEFYVENLSQENIWLNDAYELEKKVGNDWRKAPEFGASSQDLPLFDIPAGKKQVCFQILENEYLDELSPGAYRMVLAPEVDYEPAAFYFQITDSENKS